MSLLVFHCVSFSFLLVGLGYKCIKRWSQVWRLIFILNHQCRWSTTTRTAGCAVSVLFSFRLMKKNVQGGANWNRRRRMQTCLLWSASAASRYHNRSPSAPTLTGRKYFFHRKETTLTSCFNNNNDGKNLSVLR